MTAADVAVVGGGIAGAAACAALARSGLEVAWIRAEAAPAGNRVGDSLAPAALPILDGLGLGHVLQDGAHRPANASFSAWGTGSLVERNAIVHLEGPGRVIDRHRFEADLRLAVPASVHRSGGVLDHASPADGGWRLSLAGGGTVCARFLVDASGRAAVAGRRLAARRRDDRLLAACAFLPQDDPSVEPTPATVVEAVCDGWWYASLLADGRLSLALFSDPDLLPRGLSRDPGRWRALVAATRHVGRWIDDAGFRVGAPPRMESAGTTWLDRVAGEAGGAGWAAIGDAAAAFDPLSSHGMTTALWGAARMQEVVPAWLEGDPEPLAAYARAVADGVAAFRAQRAALYGRERRFADAPFWRRRAAASPGAADPSLRGFRRAD